MSDLARPTQEWADQFECPIHGRVPVDEITTKKTHLGCRDESGSETMLNRLLLPEPEKPVKKVRGAWDQDRICPGSGAEATKPLSWYEACPVCNRWVGKGAPTAPLRMHYRESPEADQ